MDDIKLEEKIEKEEELVPETLSKEELLVYQDMMKAGLMYGHKKSKTNPKFKSFIFTTRNGIEVIDLAQTLTALDSAIKFLKSKIANGGSVLIVATQPAAREAVESLSKKFGFSFVNSRWIGGILTNFKVVSGRIEYFKRIQVEAEKGGLEKYTKKEKGMIMKNVSRMREMYTGVENLVRIPDVMLMVDTSIKGHGTALHEAHRLKIPVVAVVDSDDNPEKVDYAIPANDHSKSGIDWIFGKISESLESEK